MDRFRLLLVILIVIITFKLFYKLLEKRNTIEGLSENDKRNEMSQISTSYGPELTLTQYRLKASTERPVEILISEYWQNNRDLATQRGYNASLSSAEYKKRVLPVVSEPAEPQRPTRGWKPTLRTGGTRKARKLYEQQYDAQMAAYISLNNSRMAAYNIAMTKYESDLNKYNAYIEVRDKHDADIAKFTQLLAEIKAKIDAYNAKVTAYRVAVDTYDRMNDDREHLNYKLKHYFIKASYDSAFTGTCMNTDMITFVLKRGCRYIDFEIDKIDSVLYVCNNKVSKDTSIPLSSALATIKSYFSANATDPIFVNLRFKYPDSITYDAVRMEILTLGDRMYTGRAIDGTTRMKEVSGKCIIISNFNKKKNDRYAVDIVLNSSALISYFNSEAIYSTPLGKDYDTKRLTVVNPDTVMTFSWFPLSLFSWGFDPKDVDPRTLILKHGANIIPFRFNKRTPALDMYERIFENETIITMKGLTNARFDALEKADDFVAT